MEKETNAKSFKKDKNVGHKHGQDICGNFKEIEINKDCESCILTAIDDLNVLKMNYEKHRIESFYNWPVPYINSVELAKSGFYYTNRDDRVKCNFCKLEIYKWSANDVPILEHLKWSPFCKYLLNRKSTEAK